MKKVLFSLLFLFPILMFSQEFEKYKIESSQTYKNDTKFINNIWYSNDEKFYFKNYNQTPVGIKNLVSEVKYILNLNKVNFDSPFIENSFLSSVVKDIDDYEMLNITIKNESSVIHKEWRLPNSAYLVINLDQSTYKIILFKL